MGTGFHLRRICTLYRWVLPRSKRELLSSSNMMSPTWLCQAASLKISRPNSLEEFGRCRAHSLILNPIDSNVVVEYVNGSLVGLLLCREILRNRNKTIMIEYCTLIVQGINLSPDRIHYNIWLGFKKSDNPSDKLSWLKSPTFIWTILLALLSLNSRLIPKISREKL